MRLAVTSRHGQVAHALTEAGLLLGIEVVPIGQPELDLARPETVHPALAQAEPDIVTNAAAYTAVDQAERDPNQADTINATGAGTVAAAARALAVPIIQLFTDYVFDGGKATPHLEDDPVAPTTIYGASKLAGEHAVAAATPNHVILRTAWVYAPYGRNFVRTMLALAATREEVRVVADQHGCPTYAPDLAVAIAAIARNLLEKPDAQWLRSLFHLSGGGETTWAEFAAAIFDLVAAKGSRKAMVTPIPSAEYSTAAHRPRNSPLDCNKVHIITVSSCHPGALR